VSKHWVAGAVLGALLLSTAPVLADKVLVLPLQPLGNAASADVDQAHKSTIAAVSQLAHTLPSNSEVVTAQVAVKDGIADTSEEYLAAGRASSSDWTVGGHFEGHGPTYHLELEACQVASGRLESLAREIDPADAPKQISEMLFFLLRPQGIANADIPWERGLNGPPKPKPPPPPKPVPPPPPPPPPEPPRPPAVRHLYAENQPIALGLTGSFLGAFHRGAVPTGISTTQVGSSAAGTLGGTAGYALARIPGLELRLDLAGSIAGPKSFSVEGGARYAFPIVPQVRLFAGPEVELGTFATLGGDETARFLVQGSAFVALGLGEHIQLELAGDVAYAAGSTALALGGGTARALVRF
jgi:hypothetical protein